jgi:hypothetical protein
MQYHPFRLAAAAAGFYWPSGRRPGHRTLRALAVGVVVAGLAAVGLPAAAAQPAVPPAVSVTPLRAATQVTVPLITGDQVTVTSTVGGRPSYALRHAAGSRGAAVSYQVPEGEHYVIPAVAVPFVGKELGRSLFDVSALARDGITGGARVPVSLAFSPGVTPAAPPGVTLTSVSGSSARGFLTASSGLTFAAALRRQAYLNTTRGHLAGVGRLFGGLTAMNLAAPGAPVTTQPRYPLYILQVNVTDATGQPANNAVVVLVNTDDITRGQADVPVAGGLGRVAVPAGHYTAFAFFVDGASLNDPTALRFVTLSDFIVPTGSGVTTASIDERNAISAISVTTPRRATQDLLDFALFRFGAVGGTPFTTGVISWSGVPVYVNAQPAPKVGRLHVLLQWGGAAPAASGSYRYDVAFTSSDIPADEHFRVLPGQIATVHQHFSADAAAGPAPGTLASGAVDAVSGPASFDYIGIAPLGGETMPGNLTQYLGTADGGQWVESVSTPNGMFLAADRRTFTAGHGYSVAWAHGPLAAGFGQHTGPQIGEQGAAGFDGFASCLACTAGSTLSLAFNPAGDSEADHVTETIGPFAQAGYHFTLYRDATRLFDADSYTGAVVQNIPATPATFRAVFDTDLTAIPGFSQSTRTHTDVTVPYTPVADPGSALPAEDSCVGESAGTPCQILPALTLGYHLASDEQNTSSAPVQVLRLRVGHVLYDAAGSKAVITSAAVSVSFDGGATWQPAAMAGSAGQYTATWPNPASARGTDPEIKVTAADAIGGSITQTITSAYTIAAPAS